MAKDMATETAPSFEELLTLFMDNMFDRTHRGAQFADGLRDACRVIAGYSPSYDEEFNPFNVDEETYKPYVFDFSYDSPRTKIAGFNLVNTLINDPAWEKRGSSVPIIQAIYPGDNKYRDFLDYTKIPDIPGFWAYDSKRDIVLTLETDYQSLMLRVFVVPVKYSDDDVYDFVDDLMFREDPFENKIVRLSENGHAHVLDISNDENLAPYPQEVEDAVSWLTSLADDKIRDLLVSRGLNTRAGLILTGPPGSGKTTLVRRTATDLEGEVTVIYPEAGACMSGIIDFASNYPVSLVILEDVDSFFGGRGDGTLSEFLNAIDGIDNDSTVMFLATSNDSSNFDPAVRRPGRLEREVVIESIFPDAIPDMLRSRIPEVDNVEGLVEVVQAKCKELDTYVTPAIVDSLARAVILSRVPAHKIPEFAADSWKPVSEGVSYI